MKHNLLIISISGIILWGCASSKDRIQLGDLRKENKLRLATINALSRENEILHEENVESERDLAALRKTLQMERQRADEERTAHKALKRQFEAEAVALSDSLEELEDGFQTEEDSLAQAAVALSDSLKGRIQLIESQLAKSSANSNDRIKVLEDSLMQERAQYDRELFATERMKDELFRRLSENQRELEHLRLFIPRTAGNTALESDTAARKQ